MLRLVHSLRRAFLSAADHDCFNIAQATAYSAIVSLFPALIVSAALVGFIPYTSPLRAPIAGIFGRVLPPDVLPLVAPLPVVVAGCDVPVAPPVLVWPASPSSGVVLRQHPAQQKTASPRDARPRAAQFLFGRSPLGSC